MDNQNRGGEQITRTPSLTESISHELTSHPDGEALSAAIDAYESHYFDTSFGTSVLRYTDAVAIATSMVTDEAIPDSANAAFYRGAMLGLHSAMRFAGQRNWTKILHASFGPNIEPEIDETQESINNRVCASVLNQMDQLQQQIDVLPAEQKALLETASEHLYGDVDQLHRDRFESGMLYAMWAALHAANR